MHEKYNIVVSTVFGLEAVVKEECQNLGFKDISVSNGKVEFIGTQRDIVIANLWLRSAERVYIKLLEFQALSFDDIFENINNFEWEKYLSEDGKFIISGKSQKSKLFSISDNQSIAKKAIIKRLSKVYNKTWFTESGSSYNIKIALYKDIATVTLDTSGSGLHKRGYRRDQTLAPIKETLAAALVQLSNWNADRDLVDVFCGSGTIPIEAALIAKNIAPGISRDFAFNSWEFFDSKIYKEEKVKAYKSIKDDINFKIMGFDIDKKAIEIAKKNAINAGVDEDIEFITKDVKDVGLQNNFGVMISNPPYGQRIGEEKEIQKIYKVLSNLFDTLTTWSFFFITSDKNFEREVQKVSDQKRKLYNGRIEVDYYQYLGIDPLNLL